MHWSWHAQGGLAAVSGHCQSVNGSDDWESLPPSTWGTDIDSATNVKNVYTLNLITEHTIC